MAGYTASFSALRITLTLGLSLASVGCSGMQLRLIGDVNFPLDYTAFGTRMGGLSALANDATQGRLLALSDDRSAIHPARYYSFDLTVDEHRFEVKPASVTTLRTAQGLPFARGSIDPEGLALAGDHLFFSSEGDTRAKPRIAPAVYDLGRSDGRAQVVRELPIPAKFIPEPTGKQTRGVDENLAFESLTAANADQLYVATEAGLVQDDTIADFEKGTQARVIEFSGVSSGAASAIRTREFVYPVSPAIQNNPDEESGSNGLSELLWLGNGRFLALERGAAVTAKEWRMQIRLYEFKLEGADDVSSLESLKGASFRPIQKKLVLDLKDIVPQLSEGFRSLDNIEGMTIGPKLPNGHRTLILVSDNNFQASQRTQFLAFELVE